MSALGKAVLFSAPAAALLRLWQADGGRVVNSHRFNEPFADQAPDLEQQCRHFRQCYQPIPLDRLVDSILNGTPLPRKALVVTIDDGYRDIYTHAYPVFKKYGIQATAYAVSGFVARECWLWWDRIAYALEHTKLDRAELPFPDGTSKLVDLKDRAERRKLAGRLAVGALPLPDAMREDLESTVSRQVQITVPDVPTTDYEALRWEEARGIAEAGRIPIRS